MTARAEEIDFAIFTDGSQGLSTERLDLRLQLADFSRVVEVAPEHQISEPEVWRQDGPAVLWCRRTAAALEYYARSLSEQQLAHLLGLVSAVMEQPHRRLAF